ncbi:MAG TPA: family 10 glycosylhydrolase [Phycisphaerae bacterium]|nr:family 10 glycosylhydrolase [Phycisphaerae bacterium]
MARSRRGWLTGWALLCFLAAPAAAQQQFRCLWGEVFRPGFKSTSEIDTMIAYAVQGNYNAVMPELLAYHDNNGYTSHGAFWKSNIVPWAPAVTTSFDPLAYLCQKARENNIEVHVWIVPFRASTAWPPAGNSRLGTRPEYVSVASADINTGPKLVEGAYQLDPGSPDVQDYIMDIIRELVTNYPIDGINLDHIRYETTNAGYPAHTWYTGSTLYRFNGNSSTPPPTGNTSWDNFRRRTIDEIVRRARAEIASIRTNPRQPVRLTADLIVFGDAPASFTSSSAYGLFQNWQYWMQQGYLDAGIPMNYKMEHCPPQGTWYRNWCGKAILWKYNRHMYMGQAGYLNSKENSVVQMQYALAAGCEGISNYNYWQTVISSLVCSSPGWLNDVSFYPYVRDNVFTSPVATPAMPWRNPATATEGTIWGRVVNTSGTPVDSASVQVGALTAVQTDGAGYYVVTLVPASAGGTNYTVSVTKSGLPGGSHPAAKVFAGDVVRYDFELGGGPPTIQLSTNTIEQTIYRRDNGLNDNFIVRNIGDGFLNYTITDNVNWLSVVPFQGSSGGEDDTITIKYATTSLGFGDHLATITVADPAATSPTQKTVTVIMHVVARGVPGDFNGDSDVDIEDFGVFQKCLTGPGGGLLDGCADANLDGDNDVDSADTQKFLNCLTAPEIPGSITCAD